MARLTLNSMRSNVAASAMPRASYHERQKNKRSIIYSEALETGDPALFAALRKQDKLKAKNDASIAFGPSGRRKRKSKKRGSRRDFHSPEGVNECGLNVERSYASIAGARMEAKKAGFPDIMRHLTTIDLCIIALTTCLKTTTDLQRQLMRKGLVGFTPGHQIEGMFSYTIKPASELAAVFPREEWPLGFDPDARPDELFGMYHWHGDISDPHLTKKQVRRIVADAFPGPNRVCVRRVQPEREDENGQKTHGGQGYLEYAAMHKTEVKFEDPKQIKEATIGYARLEATWSKQNRSFSMGKPLAVTGVVINPERVEQLQVSERLDELKKNKNKGGYAEWFLHAWMSGVIKIIQKPKVWPMLGLYAGNRFLVVLSLIQNWCDDDGAECPCFFDYAVPLLE